MEKREIVSRNLFEVKANASFSTKKPSTVTMEIDRRFSVVAYGHYIDQREGIEAGAGLKGFELVAVYEDGQPEPVKSPEELVIEEITDTLDEATGEDHCEHCGVVITDDNYTLTADDCYLCQKCSEEFKKEADYEKSMSNTDEENEALKNEHESAEKDGDDGS